MFILLIQPDANAQGIAGSPSERFVALCKEYLPKVYKYMTYKVPDIQTAEDLTSRVFEKALNKFGSHDSEKGAFSTWLFSIARNTIIDYYRATKKEINLADSVGHFVALQTVSPEDVLTQSEEFKVLLMKYLQQT